jgi:hypothetical protein
MSSARIDELEARLRALEDLEAIRALKARYAELVDARYAKGRPVGEAELDRLARQIAELFTEDAVWDGGKALGECRGREAIYERMRRPTLHDSRHWFVQPRISLDGDRARGTWDLLAPCTTRDGTPHWMAGIEEDEYTRVRGIWLHSRMSLRLLFMEPRRGSSRASGASGDGP